MSLIGYMYTSLYLIILLSGLTAFDIASLHKPVWVIWVIWVIWFAFSLDHMGQPDQKRPDDPVCKSNSYLLYKE